MEGLFLYLIFIALLLKCVWGLGELENLDLRLYTTDCCLAISESLYIKKMQCCGDPITPANVFGLGDATYIRGVTALVHLGYPPLSKM